MEMDRYKLILIGIFKNESHILDEWIKHYLNMGVDKILLIDNGSTDDYINIIKKYNKNVILNKDNKKWAQNELYEKYYLKYCKLSDWVLVADLDEFIYSKNGYAKITDYLDTIHDKNIGAIKIPWKMFGSNGHIKQPASVTQNFTKRYYYENEIEINCKTITRGNLIRNINQHESLIDEEYRKIMANNIEDTSYHCFTKQSEEIIKNSFLNLNHYVIQSKTWFLNVKCTRGTVDTERNENVRNENYFLAYDYNDFEDKDLVKS